MIRGVVNARREAVVRLWVRGPGGADLNLDAVIDSGFTASLTLPGAAIATLGLARQSSSQAVLADGTIRRIELYAAEVEWDGIWRPVLVSAVGTEVLVGMGLLAGHELRVIVIPGGAVEITPIP